MKYLGCVVNDKGTEMVECKNEVMNGMGIVGAIGTLMKTKRQNLKCANTKVC